MEQITEEQFKAFLQEKFDKHAQDGVLTRETGYAFSNECFQVKNPNDELPKEIYNLEWDKIKADGDGKSTFDDIWNKALPEAKHDGLVKE